MPKLKNSKREIFCQQYMIDFNKTQAAIRAGYSQKTADRIGSKLLSFIEVSQRIEELKSKREKRIEVTADRVVKEIARIAFVDTRKLYDETGQLKPLNELDDDTAHAIAGVEFTSYGKDDSFQQVTKYKINDKGRMLELLTKHVSMAGMFKHASTVINNHINTMDREQLEKFTQDCLRKARAENRG